MKICAIICEYNPFHNGHLYLLEKAAAQSGADAILCIMSGNYTQRGEIAVLDKYTRAKHAVLAGADIVIELPALFATASAEFFSRGAIKLLAAIPGVESLAFGCEDDDATLMENAARLLANEPKGFKKTLKEKLKSGISFVRARTETLSEISGADASVLSKPNNILAFEYSKAIAYYGADIRLLPVKRTGAAHNDKALYRQFSSASAIRDNFAAADRQTLKLIRSALPAYVFEDLQKARGNNFKQLAVYSLLLRPAEELREILDCTEGLENRFKALLKDTNDYDTLIEKMTSKRYTASRLKRIVLASYLGITRRQIEDALDSDLYLKVLAVKKSRGEQMLSALSASPLPVLTRKKDAELLKKGARDCFLKDVYANDLYNFTADTRTNEYYTLFV